MSELADVEQEGAQTNRTSRRDVIKKAVVVGGVVWTMPVIDSIMTPAYAGSVPSCEGCSTNVCGINPANVCGSNPDTGSCLCAETVTGACACFQPVCGVGATCSAASPNCPSGYACVVSDCCGVSFCAALCSTKLQSPGHQALRRWAA